MLTSVLFFLLISWSTTEASLQDFKNGNRLFSAEIYKKLSREDGNFIVSPFSIETVLAVAQSGAKGDTAQEIRTSLHLPNDTKATENIFSTLLPTLKNDQEYSLQTANKLYIKKNLPLKDAFKRIAKDTYQAGLQNVDFTKANETARIINEWVEKQTENKIKNLIDPQNLDSLTAAILVNAIHFKGKWVDPFGHASKQDFFKTPNEIVKVDMMYEEALLSNYYESKELDAKFLEISFNGEEASIVLVLPNKRYGLTNLESQIEKVFTLNPKFQREEVSVSLPKFRIENRIDLNRILKSLGIRSAFNYGVADFSNIAGQKGELAISEVVQKAFINLDENGVEAAAATEGGWHYLSAPVPTQTFTADHPFLFYIKVKDIILFGGRVVTPN